MVSKNKKSGRSKNGRSKNRRSKNKRSRQWRKTMKRLKKKKTREMYHGGEDDPDDVDEFSEDPLILDNVTNDDPRILHFTTRRYDEIIFQNSPELTHIPYLKEDDGDGVQIKMTVSNCPSLVSVSYRDVYMIDFGEMNITTDILRQSMDPDSHNDDYCRTYRFTNCTFDVDCELKFLSMSTSKSHIVQFEDCVGMPHILSYRLNYFTIKNCRNVSFPFSSPTNIFFHITIDGNQYTNDGAKNQFIHLLNGLYDHIHITTDLPISTSRMIQNGGPRDFETLSRNNGWVPPPSTWGNYVPRSVPCDISLDTMIVDYLDGDKVLRDYTTMDPNTVFLKCNRDYLVFDLTRIQESINKEGIDNSVIVYECMADDGRYGDDRTLVDKPFFKIGEFTCSTRSYTPLNQIEHIINHPEHKFWESYDTGIVVTSVVSHSVKSGSTRVCGSHCQPGQGGRQFHIRKLLVSDEVDNLISPNNNSNNR